MSDHLSALLLDTLAAELPADPAASTHLAACADCRARLDEVKAERATVLQSERFGAVFSRVAPALAPRKGLPRWARTRHLLIALAAALLVLVTTRALLPADDDPSTGLGTGRLKGQPTVELLEHATTPVTRARVGARLRLAVGAGGQRAVGAFTVDERGEVAVLLPSVPVAAGARVVVGGELEVTAGSLAVFACFGDHPLAMDRLRTELVSSVARAGSSPLDAAAPGGCSKTRLEVAP